MLELRLKRGRKELAEGSNHRLEFDLGAGFEGACGLALVLALSQMREHGLGPFGRADLHPRRNPLERQGRFAPQPGSAGRLAGVAVRSLQGPKLGVSKLGGGRSQNSGQPRRASSSVMMRLSDTIP